MGKAVVMWAHISSNSPELIVIWSGAIGDIPGGWVLEDRVEDLFVVGPSVSPTTPPDILATGGVTFTVLDHVHTWPDATHGPFFSDVEDAHAHGSTLFPDSDLGGGGILGNSGGAVHTGAIHTHAVIGHDINTVDHKHPFEGTTADFFYTQDIRPPYYALAYIRGKADLPVGAIAYYAGAASTLATFATAVTTLASPVGPGDPDNHFETWTVSDDLGLGGGFSVFIDSEEVVVNSSSGLTWNVYRGWHGSPMDAHAVLTPIKVPTYAICDGKNGTPNLFTRFIMGADGVDYLTGESYGTNSSYSIPSHAHGTDLLGVASTDHPHTASGISSVPGSEFSPNAGFSTLYATGLPGHTHALSTGDSAIGGSHDHAITDTTATPDGTWTPPTFSTLPPYVRLYCIQRVA